MHEPITTTTAIPAGVKIRAFVELLKVRLSLLVAFSCAFGYGLATRGNMDWQVLIMLTMGGFLLSGASVSINQILEKDLDGLMSRTQNRPLPTARLSVSEATFFTLICLVASLIILWIYTNPLTVVLSIISMLLYSFVYTPLKQVGPVAVFVGAIPGALPPLLGWTAATGSISYEAIIIFGIQFIWQFPHFWAIAWVADDDYKKAGFKLLPSGGGKNLNTAIQIMVYTLFLIPLRIVTSNLWYYWNLLGCGSYYLWGSFFCADLFVNENRKPPVSVKNNVWIFYLPAGSADCVFVG
jgi:protoheme IX farnesyltransferase